MGDEIEYPAFKRWAWEGPQVISDNGLELQSVVREDRDGTFHAGTRYGRAWGLDGEEYFLTKEFRSRDEAIFAAKTDRTETLRHCNEAHGQRSAERLMERATAKSQGEEKPARGRERGQPSATFTTTTIRA